MAVANWSTTAGNNTTTQGSSGGVSIAEGMAPSGVNNALRDLMAELATHFNAHLKVDTTYNSIMFGEGARASPLYDGAAPKYTGTGTLAVGFDVLKSTNNRATLSAFFGQQAGENAVDPYVCAAFGLRALSAAVATDYAAAFGGDALTFTTNANLSAALGAHAGTYKGTFTTSVTLGAFSTFPSGTVTNSTIIGYSAAGGDLLLPASPYSFNGVVLNGAFAGLKNSGDFNIFQGYQSGGITPVTGARNVGEGRQTFAALSSGTDNCAFGDSSGATMTTNFGCSAFGAGAQVAAGLQRGMAIGYGASATASNECVIGDSALEVVRTALAFSAPQFKFPATQVASADANTLDDYEEGVWTPTVTSTSGTITTVSASGTYTKIGNRVLCGVQITMTDNGTGAGQLRFTTPFTTGAAGSAVGENISTRMPVHGGFNSGAASVDLSRENTYPVATGQTIRMSFMFAI